MLPVEFLPDVDELPVSWMNRLALANGFIDVNDMLRSYRIIDGKKVVRHLDYFPKVLGLISDNTWSKSILSIYKQDVKDQYDIIPYHNDEHLCVCPECMKEDMTRFGHIVYHFQHQYPGSFTCWKHKCILEYVQPDQRPTKSQMENYIVTHTSAKARRVCKTSKREYRNDERMLVSDNLLNVHGPGDLFEMDEVEMDVSIVSEVDPTKVIGRPIVHAMVDVYSRMITAVSVSLENNSVLGFTNCLLNLGEDNKQLCRRYGLELKDGLWDINVLPNRLRSDRGSEYRSKEVKRICNELNITLELVPPAMGSLKGQVEQLFHQYHSVQNDLLEGKGLITKRYDSNHHRHAVLTLDDIWVFVINQTIAHNMMTMSQYPMTKDMLEKSVHPIPLELWDYGCTKYGAPRPIVNLDQFEYSIRKEVRARITRKGIEWNGLYYIANDPWLAEQITKTRRSSVPLKCRLDERNIGSLWYIADNRLVKATLNENRAGNYEFNGMSLRNYEEYKTKKKELVMEKAQEDQEIRCARRMGMQATLDDAVRVANQTAPNDDKTKNIRHNRKEESILVLEANSIGTRLNTDDAPSLIPLKNGEPEPEALSEPESNEETGSMTFEEALQKIKQKM